MAAGLVLALGCVPLSGCVSTQRKNARAKLVADRTLGSRELPHAIERRGDVRVLRVTLVRGSRAGGALVVTLRNGGAESLTDVPIAVGVRGRDGQRTRLNERRGLDWFQTHVPAIGAGETTTWVFTTRRALPAGRPWAVAGVARGSRAAETLPQVEARVERTRGASERRRARGERGTQKRDGARAGSHGGAPKHGTAPDRIRVALDNRSDVPQYGLQLYAVVRDGRRVVAAGRTTVRHLATHGRATARVSLFGTAGRHAVRVHALPTIFD